MAASNSIALASALKAGDPQNWTLNNGLNAGINVGSIFAPPGAGLIAGGLKGLVQQLANGTEANTNHMNFGQRMLYGPSLGERVGSWLGRQFQPSASPGTAADQTMNSGWQHTPPPPTLQPGTLNGLPPSPTGQGYGVAPVQSSQNSTWNGLASAGPNQGFGVPPLMSSANQNQGNPWDFGRATLLSLGGSPNSIPNGTGGV